MQPHIIQFIDLADFIAELVCEQIVRVVVLDVTEGIYERVSQLRIAGIGVHVRTINETGHILTCYLPVAQLQIFGRRPSQGDPDEPAYQQAWQEANALKARVGAFLRDGGFRVRNGVIHLGEVSLLPGHWLSDPARLVASPQQQASFGPELASVLPDLLAQP